MTNGKTINTVSHPAAAGFIFTFFSNRIYASQFLIHKKHVRLSNVSSVLMFSGFFFILRSYSNERATTHDISFYPILEDLVVNLPKCFLTNLPVLSGSPSLIKTFPRVDISRQTIIVQASHKHYKTFQP